MKLTPEYIQQLALNLRFRLNDQESQDILVEFETLLSQLALLDAIDTEGVEPMVYPNEAPTTYLRPDDAPATLDPTLALANAPRQTQGYFVTSKVVES